MEDDPLIFQRPYRLSDMERALVKAWMEKLLEASLVELSKREFALAIVMPTKKTSLAMVGPCISFVASVD